MKFAESLIASNEKRVINFTEVERMNETITVGGVTSDTILLRFTGKENLADETLEFLQVYGVKGTNGYVVTGAYDPNDQDNEATKIVQSLQTFKIK